ncbi:MAG: phosphoglycerate dehydrogenase [Streptococcaceae bacterium]|jgi:D-3-phosphoglycerate dehydrogenase|nr:phosphoglycerate dehydrogenase [Streptococcaceae bacterium]
MAKVLITPRSFAKHDKSPYERLKKAGIEVIDNPVGDILTKEQMMNHLKEVDAVILGVDPMDGEVIGSASDLSVISKYGVGLDNIDLNTAKDKDIEVTVTQNANSSAVADYAFGLMLSVARRVTEIHNGCVDGDWSKKVAVDVYGKKLGVLGLGAIGQGVVERAAGFAMDVYGYDIAYNDAFMYKYEVKKSSIEEIIKECDFISIHMPLVPQTKHLFNKETFKMAKDNLILINTARGGIVCEDDLYEALTTGQIYGAGVDVFEHEPAHESKLLQLDNVIVGSHCAASTIGAVDTMSHMAVDNVLAVLRNRGKI